MKNPRVFVVAIALLSTMVFAQDAQPKHPEPPILGIHWARGVKPPQAAGTSPNLIWHSGSILKTSGTAAIYWGTSWTTGNYKVTGMDSWFLGEGGSTYAA